MAAVDAVRRPPSTSRQVGRNVGWTANEAAVRLHRTSGGVMKESALDFMKFSPVRREMHEVGR
jgi:hypothetical protein